MKKYEFVLKDLDCPNCANKIQKKLEGNPKLHNVNVKNAKLKLTYETDEVSIEEVRKVVKEQEPDVEMIEVSDEKQQVKNTTLSQVLRLVIGIAIALTGLYANLPSGVGKFLVIIGYVILLYRTAKNALKMILKSTSKS